MQFPEELLPLLLGAAAYIVWRALHIRPTTPNKLGKKSDSGLITWWDDEDIVVDNKGYVKAVLPAAVAIVDSLCKSGNTSVIAATAPQSPKEEEPGAEPEPEFEGTPLRWRSNFRRPFLFVCAPVVCIALSLAAQFSRPMREDSQSNRLASNAASEVQKVDELDALPGQVVSVKLTRTRPSLEDLQGDYVRSGYYGTVMVGTPPAPFTVVFDTGSGHLILPSTYCKTETCRVHRRYSRSASSTGADINVDGDIVEKGIGRDQISVSFGTGTVDGVMVEDVVCMEEVGGQRGLEEEAKQIAAAELAAESGGSDDLPPGCTKMRFIAAVGMSEDPFKEFSFDGIVGLGLSGLSQNSHFNFVEAMSKTLSNQDSSNEKTFGVFLADGDVEDSEISFGGWEQSHLREELAWNPVLAPEDGHWLVRIHGLRIGNRRLNFCDDGSCKAAVDTGTSLMSVPEEVFPDLYEGLKRPTSFTGHCQSPGPVLHIELEEMTLSISPRDYQPATRHQGRCRPLFMTLDFPEPLGPKLFIFGEPLLRKYYTAYDAKQMRVGFARAMHKQASIRRSEHFQGVAAEPQRSQRSRPLTTFDVFHWKRRSHKVAS